LIEVVAVNNMYPAHIFIVCDVCKVQVDIVNINRYEVVCERNGWKSKNEYDINAPIGKRYELFHWCPKCSKEHKNIKE